ncbi:hypothetical protein ACKKBG_A34655 [Auxenochlorella protothecoides x Auxenochlorella symbiontica]
MPASEGAPSQPRLELPPSLRPNEEVFVCRYTGQIFREYEDYTRQITAHRQREWSCRYSRVSGLTYEEAVTSEYGVQSLIDQFPAVCEEPALRLVHHSTEPLDVLCATIISHMQSHLVPGEPVAAAIAGAGLVPCLVQRAGPRLGADGLPAEYEVLPMGPAGLPAGGAVPVPSSSLRRPEPSFLDRLTPALLRRWVAALAEPEPVASVPGLACLWVVRPHWAAKHGLAAELPAPLAARLRPARGKARGWEGVDADADLARAIAAAEGGVAQYVDEAGAGLRDPNGDNSESDDDEYRPGAGPGAAPAPGGKGPAGGKLPAKRGPRPPAVGKPARAGGGGLGAAVPGGALDAASMEGATDARAAAPATAGGVNPAAPALAPGAGDAPPDVVDGVGALQGAELLVESLGDVERRIQPGSIKHAVFCVLRDAGPAGLTIVDAAGRIVDAGLRAWDDTRAARNSVASTCGHDPAFVRVGPGRFALRALVPLEGVAELAAAGAGGGGGGAAPSAAAGPALAAPAPPTQDKALALVETQLAEAVRRLQEERSKPRAARNSFKCPKCHRVTHPEGSPLLLCDTCPRAYHAACLGAAWAELPTGDWACPKCVEATQAALRRVVDLEARRREALDRAAAREREAEERLLKRLLAREEKDRRRGDGVGPGSGAALAGGAAGAKGAAAAGGAGGGAKARAPLDDWDVVEEEREHLSLLQARAAELRLAVTAEAGEDGAAAARDGVEPEPGREAGAHALPKEEPQGEAELGEEGEPGAAPQDAQAEDGPAEGSEAERRAAETQEAIERLQLIIDGPSTPPRLLEDGKEQASLASALDVAEFLQLFGGACEAPTLDLPAVMSSVRWPLDGEGLGGLYNQLVLCCLIEQYNHDPPAKARSHRWSRVLTASTWPEILRRYLLTTRADQGPPAEDACPLSLDNDQVALLAARKLETTAWHQLEPELHLRLLCTLCYDISQGYALRNDINVRLQDAIRIQTELFKEQMAWRKARRGEGETAVAAPTSGKKKKAARKSTTAADPTEEELQALEDQAAAEAGEDGDDDAGTEELDEAQQAWAAREAEYEGRLAERSSRADPLGTDRFHRRYWWLASAPGIVMVDFPDAAPPAALRSKEQLDELLARLNRRGPRERVLHGALRKRYAAIVACMAQAEGTAYSLEGYARPVPRDKRMAVRTLPELEEGVVRNALAEAKERLDNFLTEAVEVGVELEFDAKAMRKTLRACDTPEDLRHAMLELEKVYCTAGEGLPPGATDREIQILMGEAAADEPEAKPGARASTGPTRAEPGVGVEPMQGMEGPGSAGAEPVPAEAQVAKGTDAAAPDSAGHAAAALPGAGVEAAAPVAAPGPSTTPSPATTPPTPAQPTPQASGTGAAGEATGTTCEGEEGEEGETAGTPAPFRPVTRDDDLDDSDAEHAFLREKRMRRPARLWRSARERAAWVQATRACATAAQVSYSALLLSDRAGPMLQRYITLAEERRRWEAEERERARSERAAAAAGAAGRRRAGEGEAPAPSLRPMMIRTGKAKTDDGVRVVLKAMGREAFPSGRAAAAMDALAPPELVAECKWGYQCSVCLLAGDLLCCEHPSGCNVSAHRECSGCHGALGGPWICSNHDDRELKTRIRRRAAGSGGLAEEGSAGLEGGTADSEATVSEGGMSDDSEATQELTSRRGGKRARR